MGWEEIIVDFLPLIYVYYLIIAECHGNTIQKPGPLFLPDNDHPRSNHLLVQ